MEKKEAIMNLRKKILKYLINLMKSINREVKLKMEKEKVPSSGNQKERRKNKDLEVPHSGILPHHQSHVGFC